MNRIQSESDADVHGANSPTKNGTWASVIDIEEECAGQKCIKEVVEISRKAFATGKTLPLKFREGQLKGLLKFLEECTKNIEDAIYEDFGKHKQETNACEIDLVANDLRHTIIDLTKWAKPQKQGKRFVNILDEVYIYNDPYGVVLIIGAWNYPILLTLGPLVGALAAGNTVILKPSELAPATACLLANVLTKYLDRECFQVVLGAVDETTELLKHRFDYIFFTGSTTVGKIIHQAAAKNLTPITLELGGKSPVYLDETADMEKAAKRILWGKLINSGQSCIAPDYLLCTRSVQEIFLREVKKVVTEFYGSDPTSSPYLSKIVSERHFKRLVDFIRPENVAVGGKCNASDRIITPTILINVKSSDPVMKEEIFGPILVIVNIKDLDEAITFINSREKPLALYIFSKNKKVQKTLITRTSSGGVAVNETATHIATENLPFGGVGSSGMGSYHGKQGFLTFSHQKSVLVKDMSDITELGLSLRYPPYTDTKTNLMTLILKRRRTLSFEYIKIVMIFCLGMLFPYFLHLMWRTITSK